jgi:hypothetical protein
MSDDQKILEEMVEEIIMEIKGHGKNRIIFDVLDDAKRKGIIDYIQRGVKIMIYSRIDDSKYLTHLGEVGVKPVMRFLDKLGYTT